MEVADRHSGDAPSNGPSTRVFSFGPYRLDPVARILSKDGAPVAISSRAFDILQLLIEHRDRVVAKDEIMDRVWPGTFVEDNNLAVQISALRRILAVEEGAPPWIVTVSGRGYRFAGRIAETEPATPVLSEIQPAPARGRPRWIVPAGIAVIAVAVLVVVFFSNPFFMTPKSGPVTVGTAPRLSIAVLPFRNLSNDPEEDYLADAVTDDLTTDLSHIPGSIVIARSSADVYKTRNVGAEQIGAELGVRYLLDGSLRNSADRIYTNARLVDTQSGAQLWAERFDSPRTQLADTQVAIVRRIASALNFNLIRIEGNRSIHDRPDNPDALDLFMRARSAMDRANTLKGLTQAQAQLEKAIALQPDFVDAISELAWCLLKKAHDFDDPTDAEDVANARKLVARGIELAPQNARMLVVKGFLQKTEGQCREATATYQTALTFDPNDVDARGGLAICAANLGHPDEAERLILDILKVDPQNPNNRVRYNQLGFVYLMLGKYPEAIDWLSRSKAADPDPAGPSDSLSRMEWNEIGLIAAQGASGRVQEAKARYAAYSGRWSHRSVWRLISYFTKAEGAVPAFRTAFDGLKAAGMPAFADETVDEHVAAPAEPKPAGDFDITATAVPGAQTIVTAALSDALRKGPPPIVIDVGCGAAVIPGASWIDDTFPSAEGQADLEKEILRLSNGDRARQIVVMGSSVFDWNGYNAALAVLSLGYRNVSWYRGGEEAWAAAGLKADDRRDP
jgi:TolB-like protein/DNA-binding winged helix-turn-helix (wHTH) protein/rhodanese-related sulfurtransferase